MKRLILLIAVFISVGILAGAYDFEVDGIKYNVVENNGRRCAEVAAPDDGNVTFPDTRIFDNSMTECDEMWPVVVPGRQGYGKTELVIPATVEYNGETLKVKFLGVGAIMDEPLLEKVILPEGMIMGAKHYNFYNCPKLKEVVGMDKLVDIASGCFVDVPTLGGDFRWKGGVDPDGFLKSNWIHEFTFLNCGYETISFVYNNEDVFGSLPNGSFSKMANLKSVSLEGVLAIYNGSFCDCPMLESVDLDINDFSGIYHIGSSFMNDVSLKRLFYGGAMDPAAVMYSDAFSGCPNLSEIYMVASNGTERNIDGGVFANGMISEDATLYIHPQYAEAYGCDDAFAYIKRYIEIDPANQKVLIPNLPHEVREISHNSITLEWEPQPGTTSYRCLVSAEGIAPMEIDVYASSVDGVERHVFSGLEPKTYYDVEVTACKDGNTNSGPSVVNIKNVRTLSVPLAGVDNVAVEIPGDVRGDVYDLWGRALLHDVTADEMTDRLPKGVYIHCGKKILVK